MLGTDLSSTPVHMVGRACFTFISMSWAGAISLGLPASRVLKKGGWGSWDDPRARATRGLRRPSLDARSWDHPTHPL